MSKSSSKVTINTGNVLNLIDIKKKAGQNATEELSESLKLTLSEWDSQNASPIQNGSSEPPSNQDSKSEYVVVANATSSPKEAVLNITRAHDDVLKRMAEEERKNLKIGVKIFINEDSTTGLVECLENVFNALQTDYIDNITLAYNPEFSYKDDLTLRNHSTKASPISLGSNVARGSATETEAESEAEARKCEALLPGIKTLWAVLEDYVSRGLVQQLGIADVGAGCLRALLKSARVPPHITQINLAACCAVPPALAALCGREHVQLLTHADPPDLLSVAAVKTMTEAGIRCDQLEWCARYQVHIKCRGVLALKGYVCKATLAGKDQ